MSDTSGSNTNVPTPFRLNRADRRAAARMARRGDCECRGEHLSCDYPLTKCHCYIHEVFA